MVEQYGQREASTPALPSSFGVNRQMHHYDSLISILRMTCGRRGRVALLWSLRKSSGLRLVWRGGAASEAVKKQDASSFLFLPATPCRQSGFCSVVNYDVTKRTGVCPLAPVFRGEG
jgi:hypothetical protein